MADHNISNETINQALSQYFDDFSNIAFLKAGHTNQSFVFESNNKKYILRFYAIDPQTPRTQQSITTEINLINLFCNKGIPSAPVIPNKQNQCLSSINNRFFDIFEYIDGEKVYSKLKPIYFTEVGQAMAKMHLITIQENLRTDITWPEGDFWTHVSESIETNKSILSPEDIKLSTALVSYNLSLIALKQYWIHGDFHFGNLLFKNDQLAAVLDFDHYRMGHFIDDIVRSFVAEMAHTREIEYWITQEFVNAFWNGYLLNRPLTIEEKPLIIPYIQLHYLNQLVRLIKENSSKIPEFKKQIEQLIKNTQSCLAIKTPRF